MECFRVENLSVGYGGRQILNGMSLSIPDGGLTALTGASGCGKSTFLRVLNRMNEELPSCHVTGRVWYRGQDLSAMDTQTLRRQVGMVFQRPSLFPMSIWENVAFGPRASGVRSRTELEKIVQTALRQAALWDEVSDRLTHSPETLSGGQAQRLCIARALAVQPQVLLLDEPTSALDPASAEKLERLLAALKRSMTLLLVTHNPAQARRLADRALRFSGGNAHFE